MTIPPAGASPEYSALVTDLDAQDAVPPLRTGTAAVPAAANHRIRLVWLGRRQVPGISAGTSLRFEGMVSLRNGIPTMYNPRYEIVGKQES